MQTTNCWCNVLKLPPRAVPVDPLPFWVEYLYHGTPGGGELFGQENLVKRKCQFTPIYPNRSPDVYLTLTPHVSVSPLFALPPTPTFPRN